MSLVQIHYIELYLKNDLNIHNICTTMVQPWIFLVLDVGASCFGGGFSLL